MKYQKTLDKYVGMMSWIQEFSKKIVAVTFLIFVIVHLYILVIFTISFFTTGNMEDVTTLLTEMHTTFRDVIGGYIIKAACENVPKVVGAIIEKYMGLKYSHEDEEEENNEEEICSDQRSEDC